MTTPNTCYVCEARAKKGYGPCDAHFGVEPKKPVIDGTQDLVSYLQYLAYIDTNDEGSIRRIQIALHPFYPLVIMPLDEEAAYFKYATSDDNDGMLYRVEPPEEDR
jgi:hypothetical protein